MISEKINYINHFEDILNSFFKQTDFPSKILKNALEYCLLSGGKRIRPLIVYFTGELINLECDILDPIALAIEFIHTYSLIHDDLPAMDNDDFRRGKPSCHCAFDEATAILVGDGLQPLAIEILINSLNSRLPPNKILNIIQTLVKASGFYGMVSGQSLDLNNTHNYFIESSELTNIHNLKTGKLMQSAIEMVINAADITIKDEQSLREFSTYFGLLFQLQDDYLDLYKADAHGKGRNSDLANNKMTFAMKLSKEELLESIDTNYQKAKHALTPFKHKAKPLVGLLDHLQKRINL